MADKELAKQIIDAVGGAGNVTTLGHCMTRLRFTLKNESLAQDDVVKKIKGVKGLSKSAGQYQMIIGTGTVDEYYDAIMAEYNFGAADYSDIAVSDDIAAEEKKGNPILRALSNGMGILAGSIAPWLGCIMGSLMISAILSLLTSLGLVSAESTTYQFFSLVSAACIYSMPVLIGYSAAEKMQTNKYMGALLGAIMIYPSLMSAISEGTVTVFGLHIQNFSYTSTIIPVILAVWLLKYVEKLAKKICPKMIYIFGVTLIELVICVPLIYLIVGPIGMVITNAIATFVGFLADNAGFAAVPIAAAIMPAAVAAGVHLGLFSVATVMITERGYDPIIHPALMVYNMSVAGAALAYGLRAKNPDEKSMGISSGVSGILGISEASLFGIILSNKRVFAVTEISILISGFITGVVGYKVYVPLSQSVFAIPAAAHGDFNIIACLISFGASLVISFVLVYLFGFQKGSANKIEELEKEGKIIEYAPVEVADDVIVAPADGRMIDVGTVSDSVFAEQMLGDSVAFLYTQDKIVLCAPANGTLSTLFPTGHAYGVTMKNGVELLVHCGVNTVSANGDGFRLLDKKQGDAVKAGDPIVEVDIKKNSSKYDMSTILIVTDNNGVEIKFAQPGGYRRGQSVLA